MLKSLERETEPFVLFYDSERGIDGGVYFPLRRFSVSTMERFARNLERFITQLLHNPDQVVRNLSLL